MMQTLKPFRPIERTLFAFLDANLPDLAGYPERVGRKLHGDRARLDPFYIRAEKVGGSAGQLEGEFILDIEVFAPSYDKAESLSLDIEALLLGYPHVVEVDGKVVVFDEVTQNQSVHEIFWEDDSVRRLLSTYVITARRR